MQKNLFIALALFSMASFRPAGLDIKIKGSDTVLPLSQKFAEIFMKKNAGSRITVTGGGSGVGIAAFLDGTTDIAMSSRKIKMSEKLKLQEAGKNFKEVVIANDGTLLPGDRVAISAAQQLHLALKNKSSGGVDPHAGHDH